MFRNKSRRAQSTVASGGRGGPTTLSSSSSNLAAAGFPGVSVLSGDEFPSRLNFYGVPPLDTISVDDFEMAAIDRLRVLKGLETAQIRNLADADLQATLAKLEDEYLPLHPNGSDALRLCEERRRDNLSHFVLRLAYARSEDLRSWFVRQETLLFRLRLERESASEKVAFINAMNLDLAEVSAGERDELRDDLVAVKMSSNPTLSYAVAAAELDKERYYKLAWTRMLDLVGRRRCLVRGGHAYIGPSDLLALVVNEYRAHLAKQLELTSRFLPRMDEDERLVPVLTNLSKQYLGRDQYTQSATGRVSADDVDALAPRHFPLCMRHLHAQLRGNGHLRHGGRMQYGLFLKGIGLPIEEALTFWRRNFRHLTDDTFSKQYAYNIRHNYGLEGKRANYAPYSCVRIITSNPPSTGDHHGCPFKHFGEENLRQAITYHGVAESDARGILELARQGHFQVACTRFAEASINGARAAAGQPPVQIDPIEHPNQFYAQSVQLTTAAGTGAGAAAAGSQPVAGPVPPPTIPPTPVA
ncbi:DNA primase subunit pri2 [Blastocladiella emersonii ATCC 22665]|nr:DNA primase subunit pri2 [Blastocladiella emersonii ATCC 22665]